MDLTDSPHISPPPPPPPPPLAGSEAHVASMVDSLLEMVVASVRQGSSAAREWHAFLARALSRQPAMHARFWQRLSGLCRDHLRGLAPHQVQGVAGLLVSMSILAGDGHELRPEVLFLQPSKPSTAPRGAVVSRSPGELLGTRVRTSGAVLAAEALKDAATAGLLHSPGFAASVRLCTAFVVSALQLTGRVHCGQQPNEPAATTTTARQGADELPDARPAKLRRRGDERVDDSRGDEPLEPAAVPVRSLTVQIDAEVLHFLQWAVRQRSLQGSTAVPCFAELSPEELEEVTASVKVRVTCACASACGYSSPLSVPHPAGSALMLLLVILLLLLLESRALIGALALSLCSRLQRISCPVRPGSVSVRLLARLNSAPSCGSNRLQLPAACPSLRWRMPRLNSLCERLRRRDTPFSCCVLLGTLGTCPAAAPSHSAQPPPPSPSPALLLQIP